jgi:hypothetical protein
VHETLIKRGVGKSFPNGKDCLKNRQKQENIPERERMLQRNKMCNILHKRFQKGTQQPKGKHYV